MTIIGSWPTFARKIRNKEGTLLLNKLDDFPGSVLVSGCQRSGTTILSNIITASEGMVDFVTGRDSELDAALILSGYVNEMEQGRYCFQTTYLNERYQEYFLHNDDFKLIWVVRNPYSVIYSILYNWSRFAFNELFNACGLQFLSDKEMSRYKRYGYLTIPKVKRACLAYNGKVSQLFDIEKKLKQSLLVVDYDNMILKKKETLEHIYDFIGLNYQQQYGDAISSNSIDKSKKLSMKQQEIINQLCSPIYNQAKSYAFKS